MPDAAKADLLRELGAIKGLPGLPEPSYPATPGALLAAALDAAVSAQIGREATVSGLEQGSLRRSDPLVEPTTI